MKKSATTEFITTTECELLVFLLQKLSDLSRNSVKNILAHKLVSVNNKIITQFNYLLKENDIVQISEILIKESKTRQKMHLKFDILYEDKEFIVINKPSGLLAVADEKGDVNNAFEHILKYCQAKGNNEVIYVLHRLDRDTSGILLFTKSKQICDLMQEDWNNLVTARNYIAICDGQLEKKQDTIISYLTENKKGIMISSSKKSKDSKQAITNYKVIKENNQYSMLEIRLDSGRKNQIRVHMNQIGHPLIGDKKYGRSKSPLSRLGLHANLLIFTHPLTKQQMRFETTIPFAFKKLFSEQH